MGLDREQILDDFYPPGSEVASHFTPCAIPNGCAGDPWYEFDPAAAKALLAEAGFPDGFATKLEYRDVVRGYLTDPHVIAQDIQAQLKANLGIDATIESAGDRDVLDNADAGMLDGSPSLGWGADYPDMTNFLDYHFGSGRPKQFGDKFDDITDPAARGAVGLTTPRVSRRTSRRTTRSGRTSRWSRSRRRLRRRLSSRRGRRPASPLGNEAFSAMTPGDRTQFVFMQGAEPPGLYCADESDGEALRVCEQMTEASMPTRSPARPPSRRWPRSASRTPS